MAARLHERYCTEVQPVLAERYGRRNLHAAARLRKVVISMGLGSVQQDPAHLEAAEKQLALIAGQKPVTTLARKAISNFKIRRGTPVGLKVTLRGERMYEFLDRLITLAIPRVKDFRGLNPSGFDGRGGYNMGLIEQTVFPEVDPASVTFTQGMNIAIDTSARTDEEARDLLSMIGMPFRREE